MSFSVFLGKKYFCTALSSYLVYGIWWLIPCTDNMGSNSVILFYFFILVIIKSYASLAGAKKRCFFVFLFLFFRRWCFKGIQAFRNGQAFWNSARCWNIACIPWVNWVTPLDHVLSISGPPSCGRMWWMRGCQTPEFPVGCLRFLSISTKVSQSGLGRVGWEKQLVYLWLCSPLGNGNRHLSASRSEFPTW